MKQIFRCDKCGAEFMDAEDCEQHEAQHDFTFDMALKILEQTDLDKDIGRCHACPRIAPDCCGCLEQAKCTVVKAILDLPQSVRDMLR